MIYCANTTLAARVYLGHQLANETVTITCLPSYLTPRDPGEHPQSIRLLGSRKASFSIPALIA
jgi:hypothetical protein